MSDLKVTINNTSYTEFVSFSANLRHNSIASTFSMSVYFDPENEAHRRNFRPLKYQPVKIHYKDSLLLTGVIVHYDFEVVGANKKMTISGYSKTGVLEDCEIPLSVYPLQTDGMTLKDIAERICQPFGISVVIDSSATGKANTAYENSTSGESQNVKSYLAELANQKGLALSHTAEGNLLITTAKTNGIPVFKFKKSIPCTRLTMRVNGQAMHSRIDCIAQSDVEDESGETAYTATNSMVSVFRPGVIKQSSGDEADRGNAARGKIGQELQGIALGVDIEGWELKEKIVKPNTIISVEEPAVFLFKNANFFIEEVTLNKDSNGESASLKCVMPEVYNENKIPDIWSY